MKQWKLKLVYPIFLVICLVFGIYVLMLQFETVDTPPVIHSPEEACRISVNAMSNETLLHGVTATDKEDGDLTGKLMVESVSKFYESGRCRVTYVVVDSANHVTKYVRDVEFTDYTAPKFSLSAPLVFSSALRFVASDLVQVEDCLDGDLSNSVKMTLADANASIYSEGNWPVNFRVTNSKADSVSLTAEVTVLSPEEYSAWHRGPQVELSDWLVYVEHGTAFDPMDYVTGVTYGSQQLAADEAEDYISVKNTPDTMTDGVYTVRYEYEGENGEEGWTQLVVVVGKGV